jgi:PhnB protein
MSTAMIQPYLFFGGRCEEAIEFYRTAIGAEVEMLLRHKDSPDAPPEGMLQEGFEDKVMHASLSVGGALLMVSDGCDAKASFGGFRLSLTLSTKSDAQAAFKALGEGGQVDLPLGETFWSPCFGMLTDRFGVGWMVTVPDSAQ